MMAAASDPGDPKTLEEALARPEGDEWRDATGAEIMNFLNRGAWKEVDKALVQKLGRKASANKGRVQDEARARRIDSTESRIVTKGFMQIPGVDYTESFAPVSTDTGVRTLLGDHSLLQATREGVAGYRRRMGMRHVRY